MLDMDFEIVNLDYSHISRGTKKPKFWYALVAMVTTMPQIAFK